MVTMTMMTITMTTTLTMLVCRWAVAVLLAYVGRLPVAARCSPLAARRSLAVLVAT